jgi:HPr kinase/phosphorylase
MANPPLLVHASCVAVQGQGLLILGASGSGKSALALQMIALGAELVADDQTLLTAHGGRLMAHAPPEISGMIEARFLGLLSCPARPDAKVALVVDLDQTETDRLPPMRKITLAGVVCALAYSNPAPHFGAALWCYLSHGRLA